MFNYSLQPLPVQKEEHPEGVFCEVCDKLIELGETSLEILAGVIGRGSKSGRLMVVENAQDPYEPVTVHLWCASEWINGNAWEGALPEEDGPKLCDGCGNKFDEKVAGDE